MSQLIYLQGMLLLYICVAYNSFTNFNIVFSATKISSSGSIEEAVPLYENVSILV